MSYLVRQTVPVNLIMPYYTCFQENITYRQSITITTRSDSWMLVFTGPRTTTSPTQFTL
ncbi:hypothetical protein RchiOBHm_Chr5g0047971 [Rosa chinensis]|uniref:Uncharacterized protein n=1 Tax=Rosa chinensis TaxID=74649 RepID=A0A2P6QEG9_ROSCH|nr:hypothetical protein RchiOBHm_Chr5g0047971 [Rosa chinensis]